jgi:hypothetical protein
MDALDEAIIDELALFVVAYLAQAPKLERSWERRTFVVEYLGAHTHNNKTAPRIMVQIWTPAPRDTHKSLLNDARRFRGGIP